jgi:hypothetical protein
VLVTVCANVSSTRLPVSKLVKLDSGSELDAVEDDCDVDVCDEEASAELCTLEVDVEDEDNERFDCDVGPEEDCVNVEARDCDCVLCDWLLDEAEAVDVPETGVLLLCD